MTLLDQRFGLSPAVVSGPVTDSDAGRSFCRESLELPCWNALTDGGGIVDLVLKKSQPVKSLEVAV
jgi:hypothetical protein